MALPNVMYGTPEGVALDQGAAEAARRFRRPVVPTVSPGPTPAMRPGGSPEAAAVRETLRASAPAAGTTPATATTATTGTKPGTIDLGAKSGAAKWVGTGEQWRRAGGTGTTGMLSAPAVGKALRVGGALTAAPMGGFNAVSGYLEGDTGKAALGAADAIAGAGLLTPAAPIAATYLGGRAAWEGGKAAGEWVSDRLSEKAKDAIGGTVNTVANWFGGGADDSALRTLKAGLDTPGTPFNVRISPPGNSSVAPSIRQPFSDVRNGTYGSTAPDLTGKIVKSTDANGNAVYTGANIKAGADIVDSTGKLLNTNDPNNPISARTTGVSGPTSNLGGAPSRSPADIYANTSRINSQISDTVRALDGYGPGGSGGGSPAGINGNGIFDSLRATQYADGARDLRDLSPRQRAAMLQHRLELQSRENIAAAQNNATLRGQDIGAATSRYGADTTASTLRRGQDMDYAEKIDAKRMDMLMKQRERELMASLWEGTNDPRVVAQRAARVGLPVDNILKLTSEDRAAADASAKNADKIFSSLAVKTGADGKSYVDEGELAKVLKTARGVAPGYTTASPTEQITEQPRGLGPTAAITGMNRLRDDSLLTRIFPQLTAPEMTTLPDLTDASYSPAGLTDVMPWNKRSVGDMKIRLRGGTEHYIPRELVNEDVIGTLKRSGAKQGY